MPEASGQNREDKSETEREEEGDFLILLFEGAEVVNYLRRHVGRDQVPSDNQGYAASNCCDYLRERATREQRAVRCKRGEGDEKYYGHHVLQYHECHERPWLRRIYGGTTTPLEEHLADYGGAADARHHREDDGLEQASPQDVRGRGESKDESHAHLQDGDASDPSGQLPELDRVEL